MLSTAKNYDIICFELRNYYPQLNIPLKKELDSLLDGVKKLLSSGSTIKPSLINFLKHIFNIRVKAIQWLIEDQGYVFSIMLDEIYPQIEALKQNPKLEVLAENILFALRCNRKVVDTIFATSEFSKDNIENNVSQLPTITYEQFITAIALGVPDDAMAQKIVDWTNSSLYIEFVIVAAAIINEEKMKVPDKIINELAFIIADAAQDYSALSTELGILNPRSTKQPYTQVTFDEDFIAEQKKLADLGMDSYIKNLVN